MKALLEDDFVVRVRKRLEEADKSGPRHTRRQLLGTSLRLTDAMSPDLAEMTERCRKALGVDIPLETYVYASPHFNAACVKPEKGRLFIMLSSSLLEAFDEAELCFVMGHELGHYLYGHHDVPIGTILQGEQKPSAELALRLFAWSRYAEISADRAGALCAQDFGAVARSLFRLASGLKGSLVSLRIEDFAQQVDEMRYESEPGDGPPMSDWFSTHPFSPLRVKALEHYAGSALVTEGGFDTDTLEARVETLMALMEPNYLDETSDVAENMRRLLFAAAVSLMSVDGEVHEDEIAAFEKFFGEGAYKAKLDIEGIRADLERRVENARSAVPHARRLQVLRDLCVIAKADRRVSDEETAFIRGVARALDVAVSVIDQTLSADAELD